MFLFNVLKFYETPNDLNVTPNADVDDNKQDAGAELGLGGPDSIDDFIANSKRLVPEVNPEPDPQVATPDPNNQQPAAEDWEFEYEGQKYNAEQITEAIKSHTNKSQWQKNLTQEAQALKWLQQLEPEQRLAFRNEALLHAYGKKEWKPSEENKLPDSFEVEHTDSEGYKTTVKVPMDHPMIQKAIAYGEAKAKAEFGPAFETINQKTEELNQFEAKNKSVIVEMQMKEVFKHPAIQIDYPKDSTGEKLIKSVMNTGPTHPLYKKVERLMNANALSIAKGTSVQKELDSLYGDINVQANSAVVRRTNLVNNQKKGLPLTPSGQPPVVDTNDVLEDIKNSPGYKALESLEGFM